MFTGFIYFIVFLAVILFLFKKKKANIFPQKKNAIKNPDFIDSEKNQISMDLFLSDIASQHNNITKEISLAVEQHKDKLQKNFDSDKLKKEQLSKFAKDNHLDIALIELWKEIKPYPIWSKREDFSKYNRLNISNCSSSLEKKNNKETQIISFYWQGKSYEISYSEYNLQLPIDDGEIHANFNLKENNIKMFEILTSKDFDGFDYKFRCFSIEAFKKTGEWFKLLLDIYKYSKIKDMTRKIDWQYIGAEKIKENFQD